jgi:hypothetical protein
LVAIVLVWLDRLEDLKQMDKAKAALATVAAGSGDRQEKG